MQVKLYGHAFVLVEFSILDDLTANLLWNHQSLGYIHFLTRPRASPPPPPSPVLEEQITPGDPGEPNIAHSDWAVNQCNSLPQSLVNAAESTDQPKNHWHCPHRGFRISQLPTLTAVIYNFWKQTIAYSLLLGYCKIGILREKSVLLVYPAYAYFN